MKGVLFSYDGGAGRAVEGGRQGAQGFECCTEQALKRPESRGGGSRAVLVAAVEGEQRPDWMGVGGQVQQAEGMGWSRRHEESVLAGPGREVGCRSLSYGASEAPHSQEEGRCTL